jgi:glutathione S-transferase
MNTDGSTVLWHLKVSNFNEKARWALDHKGVPHLRRAIDAGFHRRTARRLTGGATFPILVMDGRAIGDSTEIIAALERRHPDPPLYPADREERGRALMIEEFFDEELGPYARLLVLHHLMEERDLFGHTFAPDMKPVRRYLMRTIFPLTKRAVNRQFGIDEQSVQHAFQKVRAAGRRFREELQPSGYLAGDDFTVADLTLAALVAPVVCPEQFPYPQPQRDHPVLEPVRDALRESGLLDWTHAMYALHRAPTAEAPAGQTPSAAPAAAAGV